MSDLPEPIPAATLILMRPAASGPPELLMIERAPNMAFAAGALVFPGGRVDPDDHLLAERIGGGIADAAARIAAIRETIEETGITPALRRPLAASSVGPLRQALERGEPFSQLVDPLGLELDLHALTPFARWCPTFKETRRFDALFYVTEAPKGPLKAEAAEAEAVRALWATANRILTEADSGAAHIIFPTRRNLERLALFSSIEEARADTSRHPPEKIVPWIEERSGERWLCIPPDAGYPVTAERLETARRG